MRYLNNINTIEELKKLYRTLAMELHPDRGGNEENFKILVNEYEIMLKKLQAGTKQTEGEKELDEQYKNIIDELINFEGLTIEIIGTWIWISGNTYNAKDKIKELGFKWAAKKKMWYRSPECATTKRSRKEFSIDDIKSMHGVKEIIKTKQTKKLA
ncbi:MAG: hypothetical protein ACRC18_07060 [Cetobacterium sp.]